MSEQSMIYGIHAVLEALKENQTIDQIFIKKNSDNELIREIIYLSRKNNVTVKSVPIEKIQRFTNKNHQGIVAFISPIEFYSLEQIIPTIYEKGETPLLVMLDNITDVRNLGAIVRSCECMGVHAVIVPLKGGAQISSDAVKTSAGAILKMPICKVKSTLHALNYCKESGIQVVSASEKHAVDCFNVDFKKPTLLVMGSEEDGISQALLDNSDSKITIPMIGEISSLNVSVATGICLYEVVRQRII